MLTRPHGRRDTRPNILLVTLDTLRADHASCCGYFRATTPRLERLAAEGTLFCHAYCAVPTCAPSHASILTGQYALTHGVVRNGNILKPGQVTLAERLRRAGYATAAIVAAFPLNSRFGLGQGFDLYDDKLPPESASFPISTFEGLTVSGGFDRRADATAERAVAWLERERPRDKPFFLWVHLFDAHAPYNPPPPHDRLFTVAVGAPAEERSIAAYDGEVHFADEHLGHLLDALEAEGLAARTIVVAVSDHGEGLGQHDFEQHGLLLYEEAVRVPVVFRWPGRVRPERNVAAPISLVDLAPTLLDLASVPAQAPAMAGRSLSRVLRGEEQPDLARPIFLQRRDYEPGSNDAPKVKGPQYGVRIGDYKLIDAPEEGVTELYDLAADPGELHNVAAEHPERTTRLGALLADWARLAAAFSRPDLSAEDIARLHALDYTH
jgi:choline-sulfatase